LVYFAVRLPKKIYFNGLGASLRLARFIFVLYHCDWGKNVLLLSGVTGFANGYINGCGFEETQFCAPWFYKVFNRPNCGM